MRQIASEALKENKKLKERNSALQKEKTRLFWENDLLKDQISDLRREIGLIYQSTKEFIKERTEGVRAFKNVYKGFIAKVKEKAPEGEFGRLYKRELTKERNQGMER